MKERKKRSRLVFYFTATGKKQYAAKHFMTAEPRLFALTVTGLTIKCLTIKQ